MRPRNPTSLPAAGLLPFLCFSNALCVNSWGFCFYSLTKLSLLLPSKSDPTPSPRLLDSQHTLNFPFCHFILCNNDNNYNSEHVCARHCSNCLRRLTHLFIPTTLSDGNYHHHHPLYRWGNQGTERLRDKSWDSRWCSLPLESALLPTAFFCLRWVFIWVMICVHHLSTGPWAPWGLRLSPHFCPCQIPSAQPSGKLRPCKVCILPKVIQLLMTKQDWNPGPLCSKAHAISIMLWCSLVY